MGTIRGRLGSVAQAISQHGSLMRIRFSMTTETVGATSWATARVNVPLSGTLLRYASHMAVSADLGTHSIQLLNAIGVNELQDLCDSLPNDGPQDGSIYQTVNVDAARPVYILGAHWIQIARAAPAVDFSSTFDLWYTPKIDAARAPVS